MKTKNKSSTVQKASILMMKSIFRCKTIQKPIQKANYVDITNFSSFFRYKIGSSTPFFLKFSGNLTRLASENDLKNIETGKSPDLSIKVCYFDEKSSVKKYF
jgi:hypothetical protein